MPNNRRLGIVLSGTAPTMTLMSGAMLAFAHHKVEFDVISTTGVGGLIGMLYLAPKGKSREQALRELPNLFVSDWLYRAVPINFKVFHKYSPFAAKFYELRKSLPKFKLAPEDPSEAKRFFNDWMELWATALTPASSQYSRNGFMSHVPLVDDLVDFKALNDPHKTKTKFYLNAFSLSNRRLRIFDNWDKKDLNIDHYNAAQAMYMLFPPVQTTNDLLMTGANRDPTGLQAIWTKERDLWAVLALDPHPECFWRKPTDAYDAFQLMLMNPIVHLQRLLFSLYARTDALVNSPPGGSAASAAGFKLPRLYSIKAAIPKDYWPKMFKWTHENAMILQQAGYDAALPIAKRLAEAHTDAELADWLGPTRFDRVLKEEKRPQQFLNGIFNPIFTRFDEYVDYLYTPPSGPLTDPRVSSRTTSSRTARSRTARSRTVPRPRGEGPRGRKGKR